LTAGGSFSVDGERLSRASDPAVQSQHRSGAIDPAIQRLGRASYPTIQQFSGAIDPADSSASTMQNLMDSPDQASLLTMIGNITNTKKKKKKHAYAGANDCSTHLRVLLASLEVDSRLLTINRLLWDFFLKVDQLSTVVGFFFF
jgi:hypothetical protein